jgi:hypothetical protein
MTDDEAIDYPRILRDALRGVVRAALTQVAADGLPGDHHFFIGFRTGDPGVRMPSFLRDLHPGELTIVLQHQFWDLEVDAEGFAVTLTFGGSRHRLTVPFESVVTFADPAANFGLRFDSAEAEGEEEEGGPEPAAIGGGEAESDSAPAGNVVRFDRSRGTE